MSSARDEPTATKKRMQTKDQMPMFTTRPSSKSAKEGVKDNAVAAERKKCRNASKFPDAGSEKRSKRARCVDRCDSGRPSCIPKAYAKHRVESRVSSFSPRLRGTHAAGVGVGTQTRHVTIVYRWRGKGNDIAFR